jgi:alpha-ketoglutarate-dependent taurine dioxygenase
MKAVTPDGAEALTIFTRENWQDYIENVDWKAGMAIVVDNWRILHGRGMPQQSDKDRKILRISIH